MAKTPKADTTAADKKAALKAEKAATKAAEKAEKAAAVQAEAEARAVAKAEAEAKAAAAPENKSLAVPETGSAMACPIPSMEEMAGAGREEATGDDFSMPFLKVLQKASPELDDVADADAGDYYLTSTSELWSGDEGVNVIPCYYQRVFLEFKPYDDGGGFIGSYPVGQEPATKRVKSKDITAEGNELSNTMQFFCLVETENGWQPACFSMKSTQLKHGRKWLSKMASQKMQGAKGLFNPPTYAFVYQLTTMRKTNDYGTFYNSSIDAGKPVTDQDVFAQAHQIYGQFKSGKLAASAPESAPAAASTPGSKAGGFDEAPADTDPF